MPRPVKPFQNLPLAPEHGRKPDWFKIRLEKGERFQTIDGLVREHGLATVCQEARCPNIFECWNSGTATFMLMGDICTRACKFCYVKTGRPRGLDPLEPEKIAASVATLKLTYVVLTSVNRDELPDEGAEHFANVVRAIKRKSPDVLVETLTPDFQRTQSQALQTMLSSGVDVLAHNIETVRRLTPQIRDRRCSYDFSLEYHRKAKELNPNILTKSSIMLGLGEQKDEVLESMSDLRSVEVDLLTLGQYLQPSNQHHPVLRYVHPDEFKDLEEKGLKMGFQFIAAGPMVRSSYRAAEFFVEKSKVKHQKESLHVSL